MQDQIASYLFQNKTCPLPGLGTLFVHHTGAAVDFTNKSITAPKSSIQFTDTKTDSTNLIEYLAAATGNTNYEATEALDYFCDDLKRKINDKENIKLENIGNFFVDASGAIHFQQEELPTVFTQPVFAERVIHPSAEHHILVGDKETTNTVMTELLAPKEITKDRWWIWAIVLGVIALAAMIFYFTTLHGTSPFGNTLKI